MATFDDSSTNARLQDLHLLEEERYVEAMGPRLGYEYVNLQGYTINPAALAAIPEQKARDAGLVGFELHKRQLSIAVKTPNDPRTQALLTELAAQRYEVAVYICSERSLDHAWRRYKDITASTGEKKGVFEMDPNEIQSLVNSISKKEDVLSVLKKIRSANSSRRISETLQLVFAGALALGASDIHIEPESNGVRVRYRFDGVLHDIMDLDRHMHERLLSRLKLLSGMKLNRKAEAQDGRFTFVMGAREVEVRSSIIPGAESESIVMRLLDPTVASFSLDKIALNPRLREVMIEELKKPNGLIITTGPTGSGKTTALYAFLRETHQEGVKIITIENPVEYKLDGIVQTQTDEHYTFASGLRAVLRQDPDIIMVGEIRDQEVAETAIHAAQTGHLVFTTLHTNSAVASFTRLVDLGVDPRVLGSAINIILGQRLVRVLCPHCKRARTATPREQAVINTVVSTHPTPPTINQNSTIYEAVGCQECGQSGFKGRVGIFEAIMMDTAVEAAVMNDLREHIILAAAKPQRIPTMVEDGIDKVLLGVTSLSELERVIELPNPILSNSATISETPPEDEFLSHVV